MTLTRHSIVIPVFNGRAFLEECLESVQRMSPGPWECLVCDNGSKDGSADLADRWIDSRGDGRFRLVRFRSPLGMTPDWNRAVNEARGDWVRLLPCDDLLAPSALQSVHEIIHANEGVGMVLNGKKVINKYGKTIMLRFGVPGGAVDVQRHRSRALAGFIGNELGDPGCVSFSKKSWDQLGGFDESFRYLPDLDMWLRLMQLVPTFHTGSIETGFRIHGSGLSVRNQWIAVAEYRRLRAKHCPDAKWPERLTGETGAVAGTLARILVMSWILARAS